VYVVVATGVTLTLVPRTAPASGETITYDAPLTCQDRVTEVPAETFIALAVKLVICGDAPLGTFADV
jgi:hypothetical protein